MNEFFFYMRVFPEDVDRFGIVHHANYIKFMERARTAWLSHLGFALESMIDQGILFVIKNIQIEYRTPARMSEELVVFTKVCELRKTAKTYEQIIYSANDKQKIFCKAHIQVVCVNDKLRPQMIPQKLIDRCLGESDGI